MKQTIAALLICCMLFGAVVFCSCQKEDTDDGSDPTVAITTEAAGDGTTAEGNDTTTADDDETTTADDDETTTDADTTAEPAVTDPYDDDNWTPNY